MKRLLLVAVLGWSALGAHAVDLGISATNLRANGFPNARFVENGFQGAALKDGPETGFRIQNGWQEFWLALEREVEPGQDVPG